MRKLALHWKIVIGLIAGVIWALLSSKMGWSDFTLNWINPWGKIFINLLKLIAVPLVLFSIIKGISGLSDVSKLGKVGVKTLLSYLLTTLIAVTIGLTLVNVFEPGKSIGEEQLIKNRLSYELWVEETPGAEIKDGKNFLSDPQYSIYLDDARAEFEMKKQKALTDKKLNLEKKLKDVGSKKNERPLDFLVDMVPSNIFVSLNDNKLMLQVIFFAIFFGLVLIMIPKDTGEPVVKFIDGMNEVFLKMVDLVMKGAPFFVFALLAGTISDLAGDNPASVIEIFKGLSWYSLVVVIGLGFLAFVLYPLLVTLITRKISYKEFFRRIGPAQLLAFSSSSSAATLPVTMECVRDNIGVSKGLTSFVLPIGATVNMDGTSLYQAVAAVFLAQFHLIDLDMSQQITIILTATLASIGAAAVPSAGLVMLMVVLDSVGLNPMWIAIIFPVDRILDMCRTVVNVTGDATVATIVAKSEGELIVPDDIVTD